MELIYLDHIKDDRVNCYSVLLKITVSDYLQFIEEVYKNKGKIEGQRSPLKTKSAQRIRKRLVDDLKKGTVIPPIVLGVRLDDAQFREFVESIEINVKDILTKINIEEQVSIIDGMQRTTALYESLSDIDQGSFIRLELWIANTTNSLTYRMLVLNSGQIPWSIKRQLDVVFSQLRKELTAKVEGLELFDTDDNNRRNKTGQYQSSAFVELFMLFGAKRISIDLQEELAEEFARLDIIETSGNDNFMEYFIGISQRLVNLDKAFSLLTEVPVEFELTKFKLGINIFGSQPARAGFMVAASQEIYGIPGIEYLKDEQKARYDNLVEAVDRFAKNLGSKTQTELSGIIDLATLDEGIKIPSSKVGEFERNFFLKSFKTFFELSRNNSLEKLTPCWRSTN